MTVDLVSVEDIDRAGEIVRNEYGIPDLVFNVRLFREFNSDRISK